MAPAGQKTPHPSASFADWSRTAGYSSEQIGASAGYILRYRLPLCSLQQARSSNKILRFKALGEFLINRGEQSGGLGPAASRDAVRGKVGGDTQFEGQRPYCARFGECLLQPPFSALRLTRVEKDGCIDPQRTAPAFCWRS